MKFDTTRVIIKVPKSRFNELFTTVFGITLLVIIFVAPMVLLFIFGRYFPKTSVSIFVIVAALFVVGKFRPKKKKRDLAEKEPDQKYDNQYCTLSLNWISTDEADALDEKYGMTKAIGESNGYVDYFGMAKVSVEPHNSYFEDKFVYDCREDLDGAGSFLIEFSFDSKFHTKLIYFKYSDLKVYPVLDLDPGEWWMDVNKDCVEVSALRGLHTSEEIKVSWSD